MNTASDMDERGARVIVRPFGYVIITDAGRNTEEWRKHVAQPWLRTPAGQAWLEAGGRLA